MVTCHLQGAGKTQVIAPLLSLMLADGASLVMQCVPQPLLSQTEQVMRNRFARVVPKQLYRLEFGRDDEAEENIPSM